MFAKPRGAILVAALLLLMLPSRALADQELTIDASDFKFEPTEIAVPAGEVVHFTITNTGARPHNVELELESADIETVLFDTDLEPGETRTVDYTFEQAGTYVMYCPVGNHRSRGMEGTVVVGAPGG